MPTPKHRRVDVVIAIRKAVTGERQKVQSKVRAHGSGFLWRVIRLVLAAWQTLSSRALDVIDQRAGSSAWEEGLPEAYSAHMAVTLTNDSRSLCRPF